MIGLVMAMSIFGLFGHPTKGEKVEYHVLDNWQYWVAVDRFTHKERCVLRGPRIAVSHGAAIFDFPRKTLTSDAYFKLDGGDARAWRETELELKQLDATPESDDLLYPSKGHVAVPLDQLNHAQYVEIRPNFRTNASKFNLRDMWAALAAAKEAGCDPGHSY